MPKTFKTNSYYIIKIEKPKKKSYFLCCNKKNRKKKCIFELDDN